ncbi:TIGR01777 family oxidoreductase [Paraoerskovia sediminicola]|nr:TIGR01777 family oxidoreductase [Paraoerskovia sediminicola]
MDVVVAGSHGLLGNALLEALRARGDRVRRLVRRQPQTDSERQWDPASGDLDPRHLDGAHAVVNLGGAGVGDHLWTAGYKRTVLESRTGPTSLIAETLNSMSEPPPVWLQASAVGYYGDRGDTVLTEDAGPGDGFLAGVCERWEAATSPAEQKVRVVNLRTGIVLSPEGGALARLLPLVRLGVAGPLGDGRQFWPWITLADVVDAMLHLLDSDVSGPVNMTAPEPVRNRELTSALAEGFHRPAVLPVPELALRVALGEFGGTLTDSQRAVPRALLADGFTFTHPSVSDAVAWLV